MAVVVGTDEDPQDMAAQVARLKEAGAQVFTSNEEAVRAAGLMLSGRQTPAALRGGGEALPDAEPPAKGTAVALDVLRRPLAALNAGLGSFADSLKAQGARVVQLDWKPPAGGNERLAALLERMKR